MRWPRGLYRLIGEPTSKRSLVAEVPPIVVPEQSNVLINPQHRGASTLKAQKSGGGTTMVVCAERKAARKLGQRRAMRFTQLQVLVGGVA